MKRQVNGKGASQLLMAIGVCCSSVTVLILQNTDNFFRTVDLELFYIISYGPTKNFS